MKLGKGLMPLVLALVMVFGLTVNASAASAQNIKVQLSPNITVKLNGEAQTMADVNGNPVYPVLNGGTTYLPVRAVSGMLGIGVDWDGATQTVLLDTSKKTTPTKTDAKAPADAKPSEITVQLSPNITVKLDGKVQSMTDVNGTPVYPLLYNGTTYLPIRAVSNMLGLNVDWDGATQTVLLNNEDNTSNAADNGSIIVSPDAATIDKFFKKYGLTGLTESAPRRVSISNPSVENIRKIMEMREYPDFAIEAAITEFEAKGSNNDNGTFIYEVSLNKKDTFKTSDDAKLTDNAHVANDYVEIDLSTASNGYVRVKLIKQIYELVYGRIDGAEYSGRSKDFLLKLNQWVNIPLFGKNDYYQLTVYPGRYFGVIPGNSFNVAFIAGIENPNGFSLVSNPEVDFENAPKTVAKAAELTKNCKTDAEKITVIFEFVAKTIKPGKGIEIEQTYAPLDHILDAKIGVCNHYAILMAGMLRSQGIPCKVVWGDVYTTVWKDEYATVWDDAHTTTDWSGHVWVSVSPDTKGLDMTRLGAGHDDDGWIRLDPTWGGTSSGRAKAAVDKNHRTEYAY